MKQLHFLILLFVTVNINSQDSEYTIDKVKIKSAFLTDVRDVIIYKPKKITKSDSVKFIYLVDGERSFYRYKGFYEHFKDSMPGCIAVGIVNKNRKRDLLYIGEASKYLDFIYIELIPQVEKEYMLVDRTLYGHSFGGSFVLFALTKGPPVFNCYIASSPTPIMGLVDPGKYQDLDRNSEGKISLRLSCGSRDIKQVQKWIVRLKDNLSVIQFNNLCWTFKTFDGLDHENSDVPALIDGMESTSQCK